MQANRISYAHSPLDVTLAPLHFSELWHRLAPRSIKPVDGTDAMTEWIPVRPAHSRSQYPPASVASSPVQCARPRFGEEYACINREQSLLRFLSKRVGTSARRNSTSPGTSQVPLNCWVQSLRVLHGTSCGHQAADHRGICRTFAGWSDAFPAAFCHSPLWCWN